MPACQPCDKVFLGNMQNMCVTIAADVVGAIVDGVVVVVDVCVVDA